MSVLSRELDAYKRAVEQYNRQLRGHNKDIAQYNSTIVTDDNGNAVVRDAAGNTYTVSREGKLFGYTLPDGRQVADYGATSTGDERFQLMRQNPTERKTETLAGVQRQVGVDGNPDTYFVANPEGGSQVLGVDWRRVSEQPGVGENPQPTYTFERDASTYAEKPEDFSGRAPKSPDPSMAQVRKMFNAGPAAQERGGLLSDVIRGNGLATGGSAVQYRSGAAIPKAKPQDPSPDDPLAGQLPGGRLVDNNFTVER